jgi:tRNA threonylcarbamoyl adenosine modification protein (Sua5/YciO/YrdC/YwlC family)
MPPPVLIGSVRVMDGLAVDVPQGARDLAEEFWPGALTLILQAQPSLTWDLGETRGTVALRVPDDQVARELLQEFGPLAVSSANRTSLPAATTAQAAREMLGDTVSVYLNDGERTVSEPSTIIDCTVSPFRVVRHGALSHGELAAVVPDLVE